MTEVVFHIRNAVLKNKSDSSVVAENIHINGVFIINNSIITSMILNVFESLAGGPPGGVQTLPPDLSGYSIFRNTNFSLLGGTGGASIIDNAVQSMNYNYDNLNSVSSGPVAQFNISYGKITLVIFDNPNIATIINLGADTTFEYNINAACFAKGTRLLTQNGYKPVEELDINDRLKTSDARIVSFQLITSYFPKTTYNTTPIKIDTGAFGPNKPSAPVIVSPGHKIFLGDNRWINAHEAVGVYPLVTRGEGGNSQTYYHVRTENYFRDNVISEGLVVETFGTKEEVEYLYTRDEDIKEWIRGNIL